MLAIAAIVLDVRWAGLTLETTQKGLPSWVHEFLRYQMREHAPGNPLAVAKERMSGIISPIEASTGMTLRLQCG